MLIQGFMQKFLLREAFKIKKGKSWEVVPTVGRGGLPGSQPLNRFLKNTQNALKRKIKNKIK